MHLSSPTSVTSEPELRSFTLRLLTKWIVDLNRDRIRLHLPRRHGLMRLIPNMPFHLQPELFLQVSGSTTFQFPEESCRVGPGEICLVSRGLPHREKVRPWRGPFYNIVIAYPADRIHFHLARQHAAGHAEIVVSTELPSLDGTHLANLLKDAADWSQAGDITHHFAIKGSLLANLSIILSAIQQPTLGHQEPAKIMQTRLLVRQHLSNPGLCLDWIGHELQSNPDYLSRLFRETTGKSLLAYIIEKRMARARDLLASSTLNISEVSQACGYDDPSYFTRLFRKENGLPPRRYRTHALKNSDMTGE